MQVKRLCPEAVFIFIAPPSIAELERRLKKRGTESDEIIAKEFRKLPERSGRL